MSNKTELKTEFTKAAIKDWHAYEKVRLSADWNMFDSRAQIASGLDRKDYFFVMKNYSELKEQALRERRNKARRERDQAMRDMGLKKVRGNLGGTYWE